MADDARHGEDVPATLRTARLTGRGMRERCGAGQEMLRKVAYPAIFIDFYERRLLTPLLPPFLSPPPSRAISIVEGYCCPRVLTNGIRQRQGGGAGGCS